MKRRSYRFLRCFVLVSVGAFGVGCVPINTRTSIGLIGYETSATPWEDPSKYTPEQRAVVEIAAETAYRYGFYEGETDQYDRGYYSGVQTWYRDGMQIQSRLDFAGRSARVHFVEDAVGSHSPLALEILADIRRRFVERYGEERVGSHTWTVR